MPWVAIAFCGCVYAWVSFKLSGNRFLLDSYDTLFDGDTIRYIDWFTRGGSHRWVDGSHLLLRYYFSLPFGIVRGSLEGVGLGHLVEPAARFYCFAISPIAGVLSLTLFRDLLRRLDIDSGRQALFIALAGLSFSSAVFYSIPEQFALSGLATIFAVRAVVEARAITYKPRSVSFFVAAVVATGVVATNIVVFGAAYLIQRRAFGEPWRRSLIRAAVWTGLVALTTFAIATAAMSATRLSEGSSLRKMFSPGTSTKFIAKQTPVEAVARFGRMSLDAFAVGNLATVKQRDLPLAGDRPTHTLDFPAVLTDWRGIPSGAVWLIWAAVGVLLVLGLRHWHSCVPLVSLAVGLVAFYVLLLGIYSSYDLFLYSQHVLWLLLSLMALAFARARNGLLSTASLVIASGGCAALSALQLGGILRLLFGP